MPEELLTITLCAERRGVTRAAIHHAIKQGIIPARKIGSTWLIEADACDNYMPTSPLERAKRGAEKRWGTTDDGSRTSGGED